MSNEIIKSLNDFVARVSAGNAISETETKILPEIARILLWESNHSAGEGKESTERCCCP